ncbi:MAG: RNA pseudouridine synthase, partial [Muribaculaceae bacterium]|nr:RNA pseudouridine synthase [Muribaculaceae bacterium]
DKYGPEREVKMAHRLDQDTSGLLIATFGAFSFRMMQSLFATRQVKKTYVAVLEGDYTALDISDRGSISLPLSPDLLDRPRQRIDENRGKESITDYEFSGVSEGRSGIIFHPQTGRTHQLRVHAASEKGLGMPIIGDRLYGSNMAKNSDRLLLHAWKIEFTFPPDGFHYSFEAPVPFDLP